MKKNFANNHPVIENLFLNSRYALFDNLQPVDKYLTLENKGIQIDQGVPEILRRAEDKSAVVGRTEKMKKPQQLYTGNSFAFNKALHAERR